MSLPNTFPDTWAWDMHDLLVVGEDARQAIAARKGAEALVRQRDAVNRSLALHTCGSVWTIQPESPPAG